MNYNCLTTDLYSYMNIWNLPGINVLALVSQHQFIFYLSLLKAVK